MFHKKLMMLYMIVHKLCLNLVLSERPGHMNTRVTVSSKGRNSSLLSCLVSEFWALSQVPKPTENCFTLKLFIHNWKNTREINFTTLHVTNLFYKNVLAFLQAFNKNHLDGVNLKQTTTVDGDVCGWSEYCEASVKYFSQRTTVIKTRCIHAAKVDQ